MNSVYVGTSLLNITRAKTIINRFLANGVLISYDWTAHGQVTNDEELMKYGLLEEQGIKNCDLFFMIQPARTGTHIEFGLARAWGKPIIILEEVEVEKKSFYYQPGVRRFKTEDEAFATALGILASLSNLKGKS